jgi:peptidoglycan/LPS O-acetylase OafA/YrhL
MSSSCANYLFEWGEALSGQSLYYSKADDIVLNMGILRLLLSISVLINHTGPIFGYKLLEGKIAVQLFFIISGFYMAMILQEKYRHQKNAYWLFISNRLLKIYPLYWLILIVSLLFLYYQNNLDTFLATIPLSDRILQNITIVGTADYFSFSPQYYGGLYVFQAWTLGLELLFYFISPFLVLLSNQKILGFTLLSLVVRFYVTHIYIFYPFQFIDRFFITEINFFLFGILAYRLYIALQRKNLFQTFAKYIFFFALAFTLLFQSIPLPDVFRNNPLQWLYFGCMTICIPGIFFVTKNMKIDRFLGNLSYPMYISHALLIDVARVLFPDQSHGSIFVLIMVLIILFFSISADNFMLQPIDRFRQKRIGESQL